MKTKKLTDRQRRKMLDKYQDICSRHDALKTQYLEASSMCESINIQLATWIAIARRCQTNLDTVALEMYKRREACVAAGVFEDPPEACHGRCRPRAAGGAK